MGVSSASTGFEKTIERTVQLDRRGGPRTYRFLLPKNVISALWRTNGARMSTRGTGAIVNLTVDPSSEISSSLVHDGGQRITTATNVFDDSDHQQALRDALGCGLSYLVTTARDIALGHFDSRHPRAAAIQYDG